MKMYKKIFFMLCVTCICAFGISPSAVLQTSGNVTDMIKNNNTLYVATSEGAVDVFDLSTKKIIQNIYIPKIKNFMNEDINSKIYSIDFYKDNALLIISQDKLSFTNLYIYKDNKLTKIIDDTAHLFIKEVKYIKDDKVLLYTIGNEAILYSMDLKKVIYKTSINTSTFASMILNEAKTISYSSDESGEITKLDIASGKILATIKGLNVDNVYKLDYKNNTIATAGQDRRAGLYFEDKSTKDYYYVGDFLIYSVALSPSAKLVAIAHNTKNEILIRDTIANKSLHTLSGQASTLTKILFLNEDELLSGSEDNKLLYWRIK